MEPKNKQINRSQGSLNFGQRPGLREEEPEGFCTEAALLVLPPHRPQLVSGAHSGLALDGSDRA